ncbi:PASTA domain-containing protein [Kribbella sp. NPDC026596]|uniref:PASTA domain-containing protein n=1 Tax=Kribbella sp. NPDC026596 TaxID=3155122 RepID=UPI003406CD53
MTVTSLVIGGGAGGGLVGVPNVQGLPQADAEAKLRDFELVPKVQTIEAEGTEGTVFSQNPAANTARPKKTVVTLLIIKAPVIPPNLDQQLTDIENAVADVGTSVGQVATAVAGVSSQVTAVDGKLDGIVAKLDGVSAKVDGLDAKVDGVAGGVNGLVTTAGEIATAVAAVETDTAAETRLQTIIDKLDEEPEVRQGAGTSKRSTTSRGGSRG